MTPVARQSGMSRMQPASPRAQIGFTLLAALILSGTSKLPAQAAPPQPSNAEIIQGIDNSVHTRESTISGYTVLDHYAIYRNGDPKTTAELVVQTVYKQGVGKTFTTLSESGSTFFRKAVIAKIIDSEREMSSAPIRDTVLLNSANYEFTPEPGIVDLYGHSCRIVQLRARHKGAHVFNGRAWFDSADFTVVHLEGAPSQSPSFFAGETTVTRDYQKFEGIPMAVRAEAHSHNFLFGNTVLKIESTNYQIQHNTTQASK